MTQSTPTTSPAQPAARPAGKSAWPPLLVLTLCVLGGLTFLGLRTEKHAQEQAERLADVETQLEGLLGEVTRLRIEQSSEGRGPAALLEKLATYAPLTSNSRVTEPDYRNAKKELAAIVRAFEATDKQSAWQAVTARLREADPQKDFDEIKWLLEIALRLDKEPGKEIAKKILLGQRMPFPRMRWWAAELLIDHDVELARTLLRTILRNETSRGVDPSRAHAYGMTLPDPAAYATTGFNNFVQLYLRSKDPKTDETLIMVLGRFEHDKITLQDCVKALGERRSKKAVDTIKKLFDNPPFRQQDFFFLRYCAQAVADIEGIDAVPWLEEKLAAAQIEVNAKALQQILSDVQAKSGKTSPK
ncbi:MAG: hypothetical protein AB8H80_17140 [Planctomycetota bacterium]